MRRFVKKLLNYWEEKKVLNGKDIFKIVYKIDTSITLGCFFTSIPKKNGKVDLIDPNGNILRKDIPVEDAIKDMKRYEENARKAYPHLSEYESITKYLDDIAENSKRRTFPSKPKNSIPKGRKTEISPKDDIATSVSLKKENETAEILARDGFDIQQNPFIKGTEKNPDYLIEGKIFDCYAPFNNNKGVRGIWSQVEEKVLKEQTQRVIINLKDWKGDLSKLEKQFFDWKIEKLEEVIYITKENKIDYLLLKK